jgi:hypothetical protein
VAGVGVRGPSGGGGLDVPEVPLDIFEILVGARHAGAVELVRADRGADHVQPVAGGFGVDLRLLAGDGEGVVSDRDVRWGGRKALQS